MSNLSVWQENIKADVILDGTLESTGAKLPATSFMAGHPFSFHVRDPHSIPSRERTQ